MGTRADFYVGRGQDAEWLGSIAFDGYPDEDNNRLLKIDREDEFRRQVSEFLEERDDGTTPDQGWPWPWNDSRTTDYSYAFDKGEVWVSDFGQTWVEGSRVASDDFDPGEFMGDKEVVFPDMRSRKNVAQGKRSGRLLLMFPKDPD